MSATTLRLDALRVGLGPATWQRLGFTVDAGPVGLAAGDVALEVTEAPELCDAWHLTRPDGRTAFALLPDTRPVDVPAATHANGVTALDHVVLTADALDAASKVLTAMGSPLRAERATGTTDDDGVALVQRFHLLTTAVAELLGPVSPPARRRPDAVRVWGLAFVTDRVDDLADLTGGAIGPARDAIQPGRRIATARAAGDGPAPSIAFLSPRP